MGLIVSVDVGTTAAKVLAVDPESAWRATALREYPRFEPERGWRVQDPSRVLAGMDAALAEVVAACGDRTIDVIGVGSAMHGLIGLDENLAPMTDFITWADTRAFAQAAELRSQGRALGLLHLTGTPVHPMSPMVKLRWYARHDPATADRVHRWAGLKDLLLLHLTGRLVTEMSTASGSGMLDLAKRTWSESALRLAGIRREQLPELLPTTALLELAPGAAARVGLPAGIPVNVGATDGPLGNLGTGAIAPGTAGLSLGTSGAIRSVLPEPQVDPDGRLFCYALTDDAWVVGAAISNGGAVARWAGDVYAADLPDGPDRDAAVLALGAAVPAGSDGLVMLPYLAGERAPLWDSELTGAFLGVRGSHSRAHFIRAAVEGVALQMANLADVLDEVTPITEVHCTGGVFRSGLWRDVMAAALGWPLIPTDAAEGSALGAAILAMYAAGQVDSLEAGLDRLSPAADAADPILVSPQDRAVYAALRSRAASLLGAYEEMQEYLEALEARRA